MRNDLGISKMIKAAFSLFSLRRKLNRENAPARLKQLSVLLRLSLNSKKAFATTLGVVVFAVLMWGMKPECQFRAILR